MIRTIKIAGISALIITLYCISYPAFLQKFGPFPQKGVSDRIARTIFSPLEKFHDIRFLLKTSGTYVENPPNEPVRRLRISFPSANSVTISDSENIRNLEDGSYPYDLASGIVSFRPAPEHLFEYVTCVDESRIVLMYQSIVSNETFDIEMRRIDH